MFILKKVINIRILWLFSAAFLAFRLFFLIFDFWACTSAFGRFGKGYQRCFFFGLFPSLFLFVLLLFPFLFPCCFLSVPCGINFGCCFLSFLLLFFSVPCGINFCCCFFSFCCCSLFVSYFIHSFHFVQCRLFVVSDNENYVFCFCFFTKTLKHKTKKPNKKKHSA